MTEKLTIELPDEVAQRAHTTAARTGRPLEEVVADWVVHGSERDVELASIKDEAMIAEVKKFAIEYRRRKKRHLGITGEIGEYEAALKLDLCLADARQKDFDAIDKKDGRKLQIKTRCIEDGQTRGQRMGAINSNGEWVAVLLVILDCEYEPQEIWEATKEVLLPVLASSSRKDLHIDKFKSHEIGKRVWPKTSEGQSTSSEQT